MTLSGDPQSQTGARNGPEPRHPVDRTAELVVEIAVTTAGEHELDGILAMTLSRLGTILPFTGGSIALIEGDELVVRAAIGPFAEGALGQRLPRGKGRSWRVIETHEAALLGDIEASGGIVRNPAATGRLRSWLAVPLARGGETIGLLEVDSTEANAFHEDDVPLMEIVARALSGPVQLSSLYRQLEARERQQAAVAELGRMALDRDDLAKLRTKATDLVAATLDVERSTIYEVESDREGLRLVASHGLEVSRGSEFVVAPGTASQAGFTIATGGPVVMADVATERRFVLADEVRRLGIVSGLTAPIGAEGGLSGVLTAHTTRRRDFTGDDVNFLVSVANILATATERARQDELERRARALQDAFIGVISHELRTPITTIFGNSKVLRRRLGRLEPEALTQIVDDIEAEADRLQRLVEDLLVLSRAERGAVEVTSEPILVGRVVDRAVAAERDRWPAHTFELTLPDHLPLVEGEETYVEQVLRNLLTNAAKYSPAGSIIQVVVEGGLDELIVRVLDQGLGLDPAEIDQLFEVFYRSPSAVYQASGSGIGLFVSRELVNAMRGRIWAANRVEGGAEFGFSLRAIAADDEPPATITAAVPSGA